MRGGSLWRALLMLGGFLAVAYVAVGLGFGIWSEDWDSETSRAVWLVITIGAALLLGAGLWLASTARSRMAAAVLISLGALLGGFALFWTIIGPLLALVLVVLAAVWARRPAVAS